MEAERQAAAMLLKKGVPVQIVAPFFLRIFRRKTIRFTLIFPTLYTLLRISREYLKITQDCTAELTTQQAMQVMNTDGKRVAKIVAIALLNRSYLLWLSGWLGNRLSKHLYPEDVLQLYELVVVHGGLEDFLNTIRLIHQTRITKPMNLSPIEKGS